MIAPPWIAARARRAGRLIAGALVGGFIVRAPFLERYEGHVLSTWHTPARRRALDRLVFASVFRFWFTRVYLREADPDRREALKALCMGGASGVAWADDYQERALDLSEPLGELTLDEAWPVYSGVRSALERLGGRATVVQVGASSGREIAWVAATFPETRCIGTDPYPEVVERAARTHRLANLEFATGMAHEIDAVLTAAKGPFVVFDSGSLQYVQPEHLGRFFEALCEQPDLEAILADPASDLPRPPLGSKTSFPRGNFSYSHDYRHYAETAGLHTAEARMIRPYAAEDPDRGHTVHVFWRGVSPGPGRG